jgi:hypothetical protein
MQLFLLSPIEADKQVENAYNIRRSDVSKQLGWIFRELYMDRANLREQSDLPITS